MLNGQKTLLLLTLTLLFYISYAEAERKVGIKYVTYTDDDQVDVITEGIDAAVDVGPKTTLTASRIIDGISAASRKIPLLDGLTSATPHIGNVTREYRREVSLGLTQKIKNNTLTVSGDTSGEDDYASDSFFVSWTSEFDSRNKAITFAYSDYSDKLFPFGVAWTDKKISKIYDLAFTSVLTPRSQMRVVGTYERDDGYLSNPYHRVLINEYYFTERHPSVRDRAALGLFYILGREEPRISSVQFDYRYYYDNWDVHSNTFGAKYTRYLSKAIMGSLRGRYCRQMGASFFKNSYTEEERFISADPKLSDFSSYLYGTGLQIQAVSGVFVDIMYERYFHVSNLDHAKIYQSVSKKDLVAQILYISTTIKFK
ncbi:MAG: DUF3570 domain-containing protein [Elusimicrobia bacterium]|nr:DUF3570 domain-containing protein [Candidatus Liberimonas magnetica]